MEEIDYEYTTQQRPPRNQQTGKKPGRKPNRNKKPAKKHGADFGLRIVAVIAAIIVWFILAITQYPTINRTITKVPVNLTLDNTIAKEKGLSALNFKGITVDVEIKGMNYEIGNYKAGDLQATVDVSKVTKEGQYVLDIDVKSTHSSDSCTIVSVTPSTVTVDFDRLTQKDVTLEVEAPSITAADGFTLGEAAVNPGKITLNGPENSLAKINRAVVKVTEKAKLSEDKSVKANEIVFYDKDNNVITDSSITRDETQVYTVNFFIYKRKTVRFKLDVTGAPENFDISSLPITYSQNEITVLTPNLNDKETETITIGSIPLYQLRLGWTETFDIPLATGEKNQSGDNTVTVKVDSDDYVTNVFKVSQIITKNKPDGKQVEVETKSLGAVTIIGPRADMENLQENDLVASADLSDITNNGSYSKAATISVSGHNRLWCFGSNEIQIVVSPKSTSSTKTD